MGLSDSVPVVRLELASLILLAACELDAYDLFSKYISPGAAGSNIIFIAVSAVVLLGSAIVLHLAVSKLSATKLKSQGEIRLGAFVAALSAVFISIMAGIFAAFGFGIDQLMASLASSGIFPGGMAAYLAMGAAIVAFYGLLGTLVGFVHMLH